MIALITGCLMVIVAIALLILIEDIEDMDNTKAWNFWFRIAILLATIGYTVTIYSLTKLFLS
jgi:hypothetical protein